MIRLVRTELYRWNGRTLLWVLAVVTVAFAALVPLNAWSSSRAPSAAELAQAQEYAEASAPTQADIDQCLEDQAAAVEELGEQAGDYDCAWEPNAEDFLPWRQYLDTEGLGLVAGIAVLLVLAGVAMGASFVAAEFSTGAIGNWLTFAPRRGRVYASKLVATALGFAPTAVVASAVLAGGTWVAFDLNDALHRPESSAMGVPEGRPSLGSVQDVALVGLRIAIVAVLLAVVGAALAVLLRHTAAVLGVVVGWTVVVESLLPALRPALQPFTLRMNLDAWVQGGSYYYLDVCEPDPEQLGQVACTSTEHVVTQAGGGVALAVVAVVVVALAALVFRRRDVA